MINSKLWLKLGCLSLAMSATPWLAQAACTSEIKSLSGMQTIGNTLNYKVKVETDGKLAKATFACDVENNGWISNSTIKTGVTLRGGTLTGYIVNEGTISDIVFVGISLQGGTLAGTITNHSKVGGTLKDVRLAPNAKITGGTLQGNIQGDKTAPALLENLKIKAGSKLSGVKLGNKVQKGKNVTIEETGSGDNGGDTTTPGGDTSTPTTALKIGGLFSLSGSLSEFGTTEQNAALLAAKDLTAAGYPVEIVSADDTADATTGATAATNLIMTDKVSALIGAAASSVTIAVAEQVTIPNQVLQISYASTSPAITDLAADNGQDWLFRTSSSDTLQGSALATLAFDTGYKKVSVFYIDDAYGQGLNKVFTENFQNLGGSVVAAVPINAEVAKTYQTELTQAAVDGSEALIAITFPSQAEIYVPEAAKGKFFDKFLFAEALKSETLLKKAGAKVLEGMCGTAAGNPPSRSLDNLNSGYQTEYKKSPVPGAFMSNAYDAVVVIALAAYAAQSAGKEVNSQTIRDYLREVATPPGTAVGTGINGLKQALALLKAGKPVDYAGASGLVDFDSNGDVVGAIEIWCYEKGQIVTKEIQQPEMPDDSAVVGEAAVAFDTTDLNTQETALGNLVADVLLAAAKTSDNATQAVLLNSGSLRAGLELGPVTENKISALAPPFGNMMVIVDVTGLQLLETLEHALTQGNGDYPSAFPLVAGMEVTYCASSKKCNNPLQKKGVVTNIDIGGQMVDLKQTYRLATNDYLTWGGDSFTMLQDACSKGGYCQNTGTPLTDLVKDYFKNNSPVSKAVDGRLTVAE